MRYLLDTCALIWLGMGGGDLSADAKRRITVASSLYYSSISVWEIARLQKEGKIVIPVDAEEFFADLAELYGLSAIPPNDEIMLRSANLPDFHKDPADRIIIATALIGGMPIVTGDNKFSQYGVRTIC
ncbi:MAG: type II toxin-antitoxin system VapC family toxin [Kiritimatiellae bacterium]|nr:type II toxin-antitoxin system VapC family toxin [Kiritimatiellia bacterium]MBR3776570.1 type II toxin-antitoxin system VapC family toxin [Kiritimatiellia bacterium]